jgi:uncharacterized membrane protein SpoIIM required for sporulation
MPARRNSKNSNRNRDLSEKEKIIFRDVFAQLPFSFLYFAVSSVVGFATGLILSLINKAWLDYLIQLWVRRTTFGLEYFNGNYKLWFITNNLVAMLMILVGIMLLAMMIMRRRYVARSSMQWKARSFEKHHPHVTLYSFYMLPIGALAINGFLISLFLSYSYLSFPTEKFITSFLLLLPHGFSELLALFIASSLGLVFIKKMRPYILSGEWPKAVGASKNMLRSRATIIIVIFIILLIFFSGFIEGSLISVIIK